MNIHKTSTDHDSRYYTETEIDEKINKLNSDINERAFAERLVMSGTSGSIYIGNGDLWLIIARPIGTEINIPLGFLGYIYGSNNSITTYQIHDGHGDGGGFSMSFSGLTANWNCGWGCDVVAYKLVNV